MIFFRDNLSRIVCNIRTPMSNGVENTGTGFFVINPDKNYLITAAHVAAKINLNTYIIVSDNKNTPLKIPINTMLQGGIFENHPLADLAKARIYLNIYNSHLLLKRFFPFDHIEITDNLVSKDTELTTVGFPLGLGAEGQKFTPLTFRTYPAASIISLKRFDNEIINDFIILESPSVGGYSGGPVFDLGYTVNRGSTTYSEKTILHGIVHGTINDDTGGKLAAITPAKYLKDWL